MNLPKFLGIDIGKKTTKVALVEWNGTRPTLTHIMQFETGQGSLASEDAVSRGDLAQRIKGAIAKAKIGVKKCIVALPEPAVFNRLLTFPDLPEKELNEAIHWNAKQFIPIPVDEVNLEYIKTADLEKDGKKMIQILLVAAPKKLINQTIDIFRLSELELIAIETESIATARLAALASTEDIPQMVVDIGSSGTDLSILAHGKLIFSQSLGTGSDAMTNAIASTFSIDQFQAEQYKLKFGLLKDQGDGKIYNAILPVSNVITSEITKTLNFFRSKYQQNTPQKLVLIGEGARLPGVYDYFKESLKIETIPIDYAAAMDFDKSIANDPNNLSQYGVALGLALKTN